MHLREPLPPGRVRELQQELKKTTDDERANQIIWMLNESNRLKKKGAGRRLEVVK